MSEDARNRTQVTNSYDTFQQELEEFCEKKHEIVSLHARKEGQHV